MGSIKRERENKKREKERLTFRGYASATAGAVTLAISIGGIRTLHSEL
jgi:hypothetical protein